VDTLDAARARITIVIYEGMVNKRVRRGCECNECANKKVRAGYGPSGSAWYTTKS
jgi:hypothetical protein